jgi:hypothetical protein
MSFWETQLTGLAGTAFETLVGFLTITPKRSFAEFTDFCSISESHSSQVQVTEYPIEGGLTGNDDVIRDPDVLTWEIVFGQESNPEQTYAKLHELLLSKETFDASTGLKTYRNMKLLTLSCSQDSHTGRVLRCQLTMRQVLITQAMTTLLPPVERQADASLTQSTAQTGKKQLQESEVPESDLYKIFN